MRELKFRAWDKDCCRFEYFEIGENDDCYGMFRIAANKFDATVEQYTGLTDKNGKEIYEGDIIKARDWDGKWGKYRIKWKQSHCAFEAFEYRKSKAWNWTLKGFVDIEVIGNIHENPELLGDKK